MTPLDELRAGYVGESFVKLLYRQVAIVAKVRRFPPPEGYRAWNADAVKETSHEFLAEGDYWRTIIGLAARADNEVALEKHLSVIVRNYLRQRGRKTVIGKLIRRLGTVLGDDDRFVVVPEGQSGAGNFALSGGPTEEYAGNPDVLDEAARSVREVTVVRWSPEARREGPVADGPSLRALCAAVLEAAGGSLAPATLAFVIADRLGVDPQGVPAALPVEDIDDLATHGLASALHATGNGSEGEARDLEREEIVAAMLDQLSDRERLVLAWLHEKVRVIANRTGLPVSTAGAVKQRVSDKLRAMMLDQGDFAEQLAVAARDAARREFNLDPVRD